MSKRSVDETIITNGILPKFWTCPHCGRRQKFSNEDDEIFLSFMQMVRRSDWCEKHCGKVTYSECWARFLRGKLRNRGIEVDE